jgi:hypothetical protein
MREKDVVSEEEDKWVRANAAGFGPMLFFGGIFLFPFVFLPELYQKRRLERRVEAYTQGWREQRLLAFLGDEGVRALASTDARRVEAEQRFWRGEQARAVSSLRERFECAPAPLSLRAALMQRLRARGKQLRVLGMYWALVLSVCMFFFFVWRQPVLLILCFIWCVCCILGTVFLLTTLGAESVALVYHRTDQRRVFATERHRIVEMVELSGGLTLVESMDDVLFGALSAEVAQGGELEQVEGVAPEERPR